MPSRTNTELILEARNAIAVLETRLEHIKERLDRQEEDADRLAVLVAALDKRLAVVEAHAAADGPSRAAAGEVDKRLAVVEAKLLEMKRRADERERQRWSAWLLLAGSALTLIANLDLSTHRK